MKKILGILLIILGITKLLYATDITIEVSDIKNTDGAIYLSLCDKESYKSNTKGKDCLMSIIKKLDGRTDYKFTMLDIKPGEYVLIGFVDTNNNQKIDTNLIGIPTEPTLLSVKLTSMPSWDKLKIRIGGDLQTTKLITNTR